MTALYPQPYAVFTGAWVDRTTGAWYPAQAVLNAGMVTLWIASAGGWTQLFHMPAQAVVVKSAAQRITLVAAGRSYPILADPSAVNRALRLTVVGAAADLGQLPQMGAFADGARIGNQIAAASSFQAQGGAAFLAAMRASGARVSRLGYGAIVAIGIGISLLLAFLVLAVAVSLSL